MANLTRKFSWKRWAPDIGENRELEGGPVLFLEVATGLTPKQLAAVSEQLAATRGVKYGTAAVAESMSADELSAAFEGTRTAYLSEVRGIMSAALSPFVRVADGPHTVDGETLATLDDYLGLVQQRADMGLEATSDLMAAFISFNSMTGPDELFSRRSSGGVRSTDAQRTARKTAAR